MKALIRMTLAALVASFALALASAGAAAQSAPTATSLKVTVTPRLDQKGRKVPGQWLVVATLQTVDGKPVNDRTLTLFERGLFMGAERDARIGSVTTDSTGVGAVMFQPADGGKHTLGARFDGSEEFAPAVGLGDVQISEVVPPFADEPSPLASVRRWLAFGVGAVGLLFWAVVLGVFGRTVLGIRGATSARPAEAASVEVVAPVGQVQPGGRHR